MLAADVFSAVFSFIPLFPQEELYVTFDFMCRNVTDTQS
jgi:hypothetical protein